MNNTMPMPENVSAKLQYYGPKALSNRELLSLVIGSCKYDPVDTADNVLSYVSENIGSLGNAAACELTAVPGIGETKAAAIVAAMELGRREASACSYGKRRITNPYEIADLMRASYATPGETQEHFVTYCVNSKLQIISEHLVSKGTIDSAPVHPREVFSPAIKRGAAAIFVAHNHPSGDPTPSVQDFDVTKRLKESSKILGIKLLDHVIVGDNAAFSMKAEGHLDD